MKILLTDMCFPAVKQKTFCRSCVRSASVDSGLPELDRNSKTGDDIYYYVDERADVEYDGDGTTLSVISGRRKLVSGFGYSESNVINVYDTGTENTTNYQRGISRSGEVGGTGQPFEQKENLNSSSPMLGKNKNRPNYGADMSTEMTLSTGINIGRIPFVSSTQTSRESSRNRRGSTSSDDIIQNLGIASEHCERKVRAMARGRNRARVRAVSPSSSNRSWTADVHESLNPGLSVEEVGVLGGLEVQMKYKALPHVLTMKIMSAIRLPARFHNPDAKLYVKVGCVILRDSTELTILIIVDSIITNMLLMFQIML